LTLAHALQYAGGTAPEPLDDVEVPVAAGVVVVSAVAVVAAVEVAADVDVAGAVAVGAGVAVGFGLADDDPQALSASAVGMTTAKQTALMSIFIFARLSRQS
jgi:hypothetical protein